MEASIRFFICILICMPVLGLANGVAIVNGTQPLYFQLNSTEVGVEVENQVATVTSTQVFQNTADSSTVVKYAFPVPEGASASGLRWRVDGEWKTASVSPTPQDTTLPGGGSGEQTAYQLLEYLGDTPLYFSIEDTIGVNETLTVEITYVELLDYMLGKVNFSYPNDYRQIQTQSLKKQEFSFALVSSRTIEQLTMRSSQSPAERRNDGLTASLSFQGSDVPAEEDFHVEYELSQDEFGLYSMSTMLPDSLVPDPYGGFFLFIAEPEPVESSAVLEKVFMMIIDRSGSMGGQKIIQAKSAASFIVNNLNRGDLFNIVDFESGATSFRSQPVENTAANRDAALSYIDEIEAGGGTNIWGAFDTAIPQFGTVQDNYANIILFFTDGHGSSGTQELVDHVVELEEQTGKDVSIFPFGIGSSTNEQLLNMLAAQNNGLAEFLGNDEVEDRISEFYLQVQNPVLLEPSMIFTGGEITETYPDPLPDLYIGSQLLVTGRYKTATPAELTLNGTAFGDPVSYEYQLQLADSAAERYRFLPKVWAKQKIDHMLIRYYQLDPSAEEAEVLKQQIIEFSVSYGIISPFTSFSAPVDPGGGRAGTGVAEEKDDAVDGAQPAEFRLLGNYPNPFNASTMIRFQVNVNLGEAVTIRIYNMAGQLVRILALNVSGPGEYEILWDGLDMSGRPLSSGQYFYLVDFGDGILSGRMMMIK